MHRHLMSGVSALAFGILVAFAAAPASAQVVDVTLEGPVQSFAAAPAETVSPTALGTSVPLIGELKVMGVVVRVRQDALIHTPTRNSLSWAEFKDPTPFPGRSDAGFKAGTVIVSGDSYRGVIYAKEVFSDLFENVVVGEATGTNALTNRYSIQNMDMAPSTDPRMPALPPTSIYGFKINDAAITPGTLVAAEGYYSASGDLLYYHHLEADSAALLYPNQIEASIFRADCRIRGGGRDELSIRGGVHLTGSTTPTGTVAVWRKTGSAPPNDWALVGNSGAVIPDPAAGTPVQAEYRFDNTRQNFGGVCPALLRVTYQTATSEPFTPDIR